MNNSISVLLAGDFCPINRTQKAILAGKSKEMVESIQSILDSSDISILNLEAPLTESETRINKIGPNLKGDPQCVQFLKKAGFDIANLANNHITDMGPEAVMETVKILNENSIASVGAGRNLCEASKPLIIKKKNRKIAILAYAENEFTIAGENFAGASNIDPVSNLQQIRQVSSENDITLVLIHGGNEYCPVPSPRMRQLYRAFAGAGASAVVATHTHCPQGMEIIEDIPVIYSMGNFLFDTPYEAKKYSKDDFWWKGYMVRLDLTENKAAAVEAIPCTFGPDGTAVKLLRGNDREAFLNYLQYISSIINDEEKVNNLWYAWCLMKGPLWIEYFKKADYPVDTDDKFINTMILRNGYTCEAHNEVVKTFLRMICEDRIETAKKYTGELERLQKGIIGQAPGGLPNFREV